MALHQRSSSGLKPKNMHRISRTFLFLHDFAVSSLQAGCSSRANQASRPCASSMLGFHCSYILHVHIFTHARIYIYFYMYTYIYILHMHIYIYT